MPPFKQVESLKSLCEEALVKMVLGYERMLVDNIEELKYGQEMGTLSDEHQYLLLWYLPDQLYTDFVTKLLKKFKKDIKKKAKLLELFINKKLKRLDCFDLPYQTVVQIQKRFNFLEEITHFHIDYLGSYEAEIMLPAALSNMKKLASCTLKRSCRNEMIEAISNHCPNLHSLDISSSLNVTNIKCLLKCKKLKKLLILGFAIPFCDIAEFILENETLSELRVGNVHIILEYLMNKQPTTIQHPSTLKRFDLSLSWTKQLKFAHSFFPYLETIECDSCHGMDFSYLKFFKHLKELTCFLQDYDETLSSFLHERGLSLTSLNIIISFAEWEELIYDLMEFCPNLKVFFFKFCNWSSQNQKYKNKLRIKRSWNLEKLGFSVRGTTNLLELILMNTPNIKCVQIHYRFLSDNVLCNILSANTMSNLEEFTVINHHYNLTMKSLRLLLTSCPKLKAIRNLEFWAISREEFQTLERDIKYSNWDLNITENTDTWLF